MHFSKIKSMVVVLTAAAAVSAQFNVPGNARTDGIGGAPMADISNVFSYPSLMMGYTDQLQATFNGDMGIIGVKSISETFAIGMLANQRLMTDAPRGTDFSAGAISALAGNGASGFTEAYTIPHLLLGFDLGNIQLGADIFFEYARYSAHAESGNNETSNGGLIIHPGARVSLGTNAGDIGIMAKFGIGVPNFSGENDQGSASTKVSSDKGLYMELGAELGLPLMGLDWTFGAQYVSVGHRAKIGSAKQTDYGNSLVDVYGGFEFNVLETAAAAFGYTFSREAGLTYVEDADGDRNGINRSIEHSHTFNAGIENIWDDTWFFDAVALRCGASYEATVDIASARTDDPKTTSRTKSPATQGRVIPVMGTGFSYSFLTLDLAVNPGFWGGLFTGPGVYMASGTIKF